MRHWKVLTIVLAAVSLTASAVTAMVEEDEDKAKQPPAPTGPALIRPPTPRYVPSGPYVLSQRPPYDFAAFVLGQRQEKEKAAYLGVSATPEMPAVLRKQLGLPSNVGMVVEHVDSDSPAKAIGVQKDDVLYKLDDQLVINQHQLAVLVRMHSPGSEVTLTVIRQAKQEQLKVKLAEKELPKLRPPGQPSPLGSAHLIPQPGSAYLEALRVMGQAMEGRPLTAGQTKITLHDGDQVLTITIGQDGKRHLQVKDGKGKVLFDGPVEDLKQRQAQLEDIGKKLQKMEKGLKMEKEGIKVEMDSPQTQPAPQKP
jgi:hypothetical protein